MLYNKRYVCIVLSIVLTFLMTLSLLSPISASIIYNTNKLSSELIEKLQDMSGEDTEDVYVFLKRIDKNDVKEKLSNGYGKNMDIYEDSDKFYSEVVSELIVDNQTVSRIIGTSNLTEDFLSDESVDSELNLSTKKEILAKIQTEMNILQTNAVHIKI